MIDGKISFAVAGQSLAEIFRKRGRTAFAKRLKEIAPTAPEVRIWGHTKGGSVAASNNRFSADVSSRQYFWWDVENDRLSLGVERALGGLDAFLEHPCEALFWDQGQSEAPLVSHQARDPEEAAETYRHATIRILASLRERLAPEDPLGLPILLRPHAPHPLENRVGNGVRRIRAIQYELIGAIPNCHDAGVVYGMDMLDNVHPTQAGLDVYAATLAEAFARVVLPRIVTAVPSRPTPSQS